MITRALTKYSFEMIKPVLNTDRCFNDCTSSCNGKDNTSVLNIFNRSSTSNTRVNKFEHFLLHVITVFCFIQVKTISLSLLWAQNYFAFGNVLRTSYEIDSKGTRKKLKRLSKKGKENVFSVVFMVCALRNLTWRWVLLFHLVFQLVSRHLLV